MRTVLRTSILAAGLAAAISCDSATSPGDLALGCFEVVFDQTAPANLTPTSVLQLSDSELPGFDTPSSDLRIARPSPAPGTGADWLLHGAWYFLPADTLRVNAFSNTKRMWYTLTRQHGPQLPGELQMAEFSGTATYITGGDMVAWKGGVSLVRTFCAD